MQATSVTFERNVLQRRGPHWQDSSTFRSDEAGLVRACNRESEPHEARTADRPRAADRTEIRETDADLRRGKRKPNADQMDQCNEAGDRGRSTPERERLACSPSSAAHCESHETEGVAAENDSPNQDQPESAVTGNALERLPEEARLADRQHQKRDCDAHSHTSACESMESTASVSFHELSPSATGLTALRFTGQNRDG